ncbi:hypothetical protein, conserved [Eimeria tenella]|uniref:Uncharacterized protein n=1 Tax=Eimeria tenella TaxID=5802 RepID=U6KWM9_EIMTE|nr:hypothetical protein, conserved [Eimeria tenella]CDJ42527.1 hypothetical protein, conserved [Eimeria tenella]|eukprot:XP_013233277.1 hypothetical protein, conserved [Eimeria tenella]
MGEISASMYASRIENAEAVFSAPTKGSELLASLTQECEEAADICNCQPYESCT